MIRLLEIDALDPIELVLRPVMLGEDLDRHRLCLGDGGLAVPLPPYASERQFQIAGMVFGDCYMGLFVPLDVGHTSLVSPCAFAR